MDPLTHVLVGGLVAKTAKTSRRRFWIMMFLGEAPDFDFIFSGLGSWAFWLQHRGITHSFIGVVIQAFFYSWAFAKIDPGVFKTRLWQYSLPLLFHIFCDYLTSYGVPLLSPFSFHEFAGDLMPGVTLIPLVFMLVGLIYLVKKGHDGWVATHPLWMAWGLYVVFSLSGRSYATQLLEQQHKKAVVISGTINPFDWNAVVQNKTYGYEAYSVDVLLKETRKGPQLNTPLTEFPIRASLESPQVKKFVETSRWPTARVQPTLTGWDVEWGRMMFSARGIIRGALIVHLSQDGSVTGVERTFGFWDPVEKNI